ncbi:cytochrome c/c1 heme-lyase [Cladochytrium replicatum]|nr:cytochrome c/c1 heme-lyase [Cladochytrium replicatum]
MSSSKATECPVDHSSMKKGNRADGVACPVDHSKMGGEQLNPLNMMPKLGQEMAAGQTTPLPTSREDSTIPKGQSSTSAETWEYPSPQQFYNALKRKGWETPVEDVPVMVQIHNFLNEACWGEILKWEQKYHCECKNPTLLRFKGRPQELSPKARMMMAMGAERPFDRHDWMVDRCGTEVRYVIDYYSAAPEGGSPVFHLDVRPALDSPTALLDRGRSMFSEIMQKCFPSSNGARSGAVEK